MTPLNDANLNSQLHSLRLPAESKTEGQAAEKTHVFH